MPELTQDLFLSKKEQVYQFIKRRGRARTSEVAAFGVSIYHPDRACRDARDMAAENPPKIWRIKESVKLSIQEYKNSKEEIWSIFEADK